jgi:hypothetical protein
MSQVLELAKQGDTSAIAALMNRSLAPQGIKARVLLEGQTLKVLLEGLEVPVQERFTNYTLQGLRKIGVATAILEIYGKQSDTQGFAWSQRFQVEGDNFTPVTQPSPTNPFAAAAPDATRPESTSPEPISPEPISPEPISPESISPESISPESISPEPTSTPANSGVDLDPSNIQSLAKQGNIAAIEAFVKSALSDREELESFVELVDDVLKVTIQTKQFLDGPAFCGEFGTKMNGIHGGVIRELEVYKRKSEKTAPFLMKKMTLFSAGSAATSSRPTATPNASGTNGTGSMNASSSVTVNARPHGQSSAMRYTEPVQSYNSTGSQERPTGILIVAILYFVLAGIGLFGSLTTLMGMMALSAAMGSAMQSGEAEIPVEGASAVAAIGSLMVAITIVLALLSAGRIAVGIGLLQMKKWAVLCAMIIEAISAVIGLVGLLSSWFWGSLRISISVSIFKYMLTDEVQSRMD